MKAVVDVVTITPKKATEFLENIFGAQRHVRETWVKSLADDMRSGNFRMSCDALVLIKGQLANGQHRLWAVVESGMPQPFILMRTDDDELYKVLDSGIRRTVGDALGIVNGSQASAIGNLAFSYDNKTLTTLSFKKKPSRVELIEYVEKYGAELQHAVQVAGRLTTSMNLVPKSVTGAFSFLARREHGEKVDAFLNHVYSGDLPDSVCSLLRDRYLKAKVVRSASSSLSSQYALALMIKAFNSHVKGSKISVLKLLDGEEYPQIVAAEN